MTIFVIVVIKMEVHKGVQQCLHHLVVFKVFALTLGLKCTYYTTAVCQGHNQGNMYLRITILIEMQLGKTNWFFTS